MRWVWGSRTVWLCPPRPSLSGWFCFQGVLCRTLQGHAHWVNTMALSTDYVLRTGAFEPAEATINPQDLSGSCECSTRVVGWGSRWGGERGGLMSLLNAAMSQNDPESWEQVLCWCRSCWQPCIGLTTLFSRAFPPYDREKTGEQSQTHLLGPQSQGWNGHHRVIKFPLTKSLFLLFSLSLSQWQN